MQTQSTHTTDDQLRALALALRDKYLADARQAMKMVKQIEQAYGLVPVTKRGKT